MIPNKTIDGLYNRLLSYACSREAKKVCELFINSSETTEDEIILELTLALDKGLNKGIWPWTSVQIQNNNVRASVRAIMQELGPPINVRKMRRVGYWKRKERS